MDDLLQRLQAFAENNKDSLYPIAIAIKKQTEPSVAVINKTVTTNILFTEISKSYQLLKNELLSNGNFMEDSIMLHIKEPVGNSTSYMIGMPAKKSAAASNTITYMIMPPNGNMLVANFTGLYKERKKVYGIIEEYISDKSISKASLAYEKIDAKKIPASFDEQVTVNVCFPVY
jgi:effector-binding domain-containing protein